MTLKTQLLGSAAHFRGLGKGLGPAAKGSKAEDDSDDDEAKKAKKSEKSAESGDEADAEGKKAAESDSDDEEDDDEEDDDDDAEMRAAVAIPNAAKRQQAVTAALATIRAGAHAEGVTAERQRCAAIFAHPNAAKSPDFAARLAFSTTMATQEALALMETAPAGSTLAGRMSGQKQPNLGPGGQPEDQSARAMASSWDKALKR